MQSLTTPSKSSNTASKPTLATQNMKRKQKPKPRYRLRLVIDADDPNDDSWKGYDFDNSKPWPLGSFDSEKQAITARNSVVVMPT
jgi:hypothetical protein